MLTSQDGEDIECLIEESSISTPYIIQAGQPDALQYFLVAEKAIYFEVTGFQEALMSLMALYFVYDIVYAKECGNTLLFLERKIFGLRSSQKFSPTVCGIMSDIQNTV